MKLVADIGTADNLNYGGHHWLYYVNRDGERRKEWDEAKHPRVPAGSSEGGEFTEGDVGFVSPNVGELSFPQAERRLTGQRHADLVAASHEIDQRLGITAHTAPVIGAWADGAENSLMVTMAPGGDPGLERAALAMKGWLANQKAVLYFHADPQGKDYMAKLPMPGTVARVHAEMLRRGVEFHTLEKTDDGVLVYVYGHGQENLDKLQKAADDHRTELTISTGTGELIGTTLEGGTDSERRADARRVYEKVVEAASGGKAGHIWPELRSHWASRLQQSEHPPLEGIAPGSNPAKISPAVTSTKFATVDSDQTYVPASLDQMRKDPGVFEHNMNLLKVAEMYPTLRPVDVAGSPEEIAAAAQAQIRSNIRYIYDHATPEEHRAIEWYRGANRYAGELADQYKLDKASTSAVIAALSPKKDWDQNVYMARAMIDTVMTKQNEPWTPQMSKTGNAIWKSAAQKAVYAEIKDKKLSELSNPEQIGAWVRTYDETVSDRHYQTFNPDGSFGEIARNTPAKPGKLGTPKTAAWQTGDFLTNSVIALRSGGDRTKISDALGERHKVRNFYNNIIGPDDNDGDITVDSHAVGAGWLRPLSLKTAPVIHALASTPEVGNYPPGWKPHRNSPRNGVYGLYGLYADSYREVAKEVGIKPSELQAVVWVTKRTAMNRISKSTVTAIDSAWREYYLGNASLLETQDKVWNAATKRRE